MNDDQNTPQPQPWIDPALEARIVADVLGETSAFEQAELERLLAENPELALFKRRIEAVQGLVNAATGPDSPKLQLGAERRKALLETLGAPTASPEKPIFTLPAPAWWTAPVWIRLAASVVVGAVFVSFLSSVMLFRSGEVARDGEGVAGGEFGFVLAEGRLGDVAVAVPMPLVVASAPPAAAPQTPTFAGFDSALQPPSASQAPVARDTVSTLVADLSVPQVQLAMREEAKDKNSLRENSELRRDDGDGAESEPADSRFEIFRKAGDGVIHHASPILTEGTVSETALNRSILTAAEASQQVAVHDGESVSVGGLTPSSGSSIKAFTGGWGKGSGSGTGVRERDALVASKPEALAMPGMVAAPTSVLSTPSAAVGRPQVPYAPLEAPVVDLMTAQSVTTSSGRQTNTQVIREFSYPSEFVQQQADRVSDADGPNGEAFEGQIHYGAPLPAEGTISGGVVNEPVFSSRNGVVEFDGYINYGSPIIVPEAEDAKRRLEEAKSFSASGRLDLALKRYEQTLAADPYNIEARRGLDEVNKAKARYAETAYDEALGSKLWQVAAAWERPVRSFRTGGSVTEFPQLASGIESASINRKLDEIVIPRIDLRETTVAEAVEFLKQRSKQLDSGEEDPGKKGVNIVLKLPPEVDASSKITLSLTDVSLREAMRYVTELANLKLNVEPYAVAIVPQSEVSTSLVAKEYHVPPELLSSSGAKEYLSSLGVPFPAGASATYFANTSKLVVKNTSSNMEMIDALLDVPAKQPASAALARPPHLSVDEILTSKQPFSTFSLKVSDVSFQLARDALNKGTRPEPERIRTEEFYNALDYNDPAPGPGEEVACRIETARHPFLQQRDLVRIAVKVAAAGRAAGQPLRLTILLDTSGSMEREDRAASVRQALKTLAGLLGPQDRVNLIGFARTPRLLAEQVPGDQAGTLVEIAARTPSEGGTDLEQALVLASEQALKHRLPAAQNRIVLLTDGAANLGDADPVRLARQIESTRQQGISFDACGVGAKGLNDEILEALTRKGDGRYYFLNTPEDADAGFARQLAGALRPAAENVKVQVVFNPARVHQYRLLGFEKHLLKREDFRNDAVQAAELSAEEAGVALYQVETRPDGEGELGQVFVRFRDPATGRMVERSWTMPYEERIPAFDQAPPSLQLAATAALLAEKLRGDDRVDLEVLAPVLTRLRKQYPHQVRVAELIRMFEQVRAGQAP